MDTDILSILAVVRRGARNCCEIGDDDFGTANSEYADSCADLSKTR